MLQQESPFTYAFYGAYLSLDLYIYLHPGSCVSFAHRFVGPVLCL